MACMASAITETKPLVEHLVSKTQCQPKANPLDCAQDVWYNFRVKMVTTCKRTGQLSYEWEQVSCYARHDTEFRCLLVLCLDCPTPVRKQLEGRLSSVPSASDSWHETFLESMRDLFDESVWLLRHPIRGSERNRTTLSPFDGAQPDFLHFHEMARHVIHSNECLDVAIDTIERILKDFKRRCHPESDGVSNFLSSIAAVGKDLRGIKRRSEALQERLQNEINLVS
jgi:hypothetical protein